MKASIYLEVSKGFINIKIVINLWKLNLTNQGE